MEEMGTKEAAKLWGVPQWKVQKYCRKMKNMEIRQEKEGGKYLIPKDYPNPFNSQ